MKCSECGLRNMHRPRCVAGLFELLSSVLPQLDEEQQKELHRLTIADWGTFGETERLNFLTQLERTGLPWLQELASALSTSTNRTNQ